MSKRDADKDINMDSIITAAFATPPLPRKKSKTVREQAKKPAPTSKRAKK